MTAQAVADLVGGRLSGPGDVVLRRVRALERAESDALAMCTGARWVSALAATRAGAVLLPSALSDAPGPASRIIVDNPAHAMSIAALAIHPPYSPARGVAPTARLGRGVVLGDAVAIGDYAVIGHGVVLGNRVVIGPHVVIEGGVVLGHDVRLDAHVVVHAGAVLGERVWCQAHAVIGGAGFGFLPTEGGHGRVPQVGGCILGDDVEVGSSSCIDRGSLDDTIIGRGTKIDNHVHVAHNVRIGEHCLLMAGVGVSGSTRLGDRVILAGQSGVVGHVTIGDDARVGAQAGVISSIAPATDVSGFPARPHREFLKGVAALYRLAPLVNTLEAVAKEHDDA